MSLMVNSKKIFKRIYKFRYLYLIFLPVLIYFIVFSYFPMYGVQIAFKDYRYKLGILGSPWVGLKYFRMLIGNGEFIKVLINTVFISFLRLIFGFPAPIIFALLINEILNIKFKRIVQTISYLPNFISWVVLGGIFKEMLSPSRGVINYFLTLLGKEPVYFLTSDFWFIVIIIITGIWQSFGWGAIIFLAAISAIDQEQYEASIMDGANRLQRACHITLPAIMPVISIVLILNMSGILNAGFDQIFNLYNPTVYSVADILDTYVYRRGILNVEFSFTTAVGLFKNVVGLIFVMLTNFIVKKLNGEGIW